MIMDDQVFVPGVVGPESFESAVWFAFSGGKMLVQSNAAGVQIPQSEKLPSLGVEPVSEHFLGYFNRQPCYAVELAECQNAAMDEQDLQLMDMRPLAMSLDENVFMLAGRALQVLKWHRDHRFCGRCGAKMRDHSSDRAKICDSCGHSSYPRISPCIIVLIKRAERFLLGRAPQWPAGLYSTLAGFVEPGETLEQAVHREIQEEVGIKVTDLQYFSSQPWPFPHSLMIGFVAHYSSGDIQVDGVEIADAQWFSADNLPLLPPPGSISRRLIQAHLDSL